LEGSINLARGAIQAGVRRFIGIGSCFEYDLNFCPLSTNSLLSPTTVYGSSKVALFMSLSRWFPLHSVEFAWCRLFYLYGEGENPRRLVAYLRSKLGNGEPAELSSGTQKRDYLDVAEAGRMIADIAVGNRTGPINICSGVSVTVRQLAEQIADEFGRRDLLMFGVRPENLVDPPCVVGVSES